MAPEKVEGPGSREETEGRAHSGIRRNDETGRAQFLGETIGMNRARAAEGHNRYDLGISTLFRDMGLGCAAIVSLMRSWIPQTA